MDELRKIPPVTRFLLASTLCVTLPVILEIYPVYNLLFVKEYVLKRLEIWRPFTSFFFAGTGLSLVFDCIMLYRTSDSLEGAFYGGRSADYAWQLLLNAFGILMLNIPLKSFIHFRPLLLSIITLSSRLTPSAPVSIFGLVTLENQYFPYVMLGMDLLQGGPSAAAKSLTGLISGYAWWYLVHSIESGRPFAPHARAPRWMQALVGEGRGATGVNNTRAASAAAAATRQTAHRAAATVQEEGHRWGAGHRLG